MPVITAQCILATDWFDGPISGFLVTESEVFRYEIVSSNIAGGIYDERWYLVQPLVATPE